MPVGGLNVNHSLSHRLGLIGFQGIASKFALQKVCDELNNPSLPTVSKWRGHRGHWECMLSPATSKAGENRGKQVCTKSQSAPVAAFL